MIGLWRKGGLSADIFLCPVILSPHRRRYLRRASTVALALTLLLVFAANYHAAVRTIGFNAILAGTTLLVVSLACGFVLGGRPNDKSTVLAFGTAQRDISAALVVSVENFSDPNIVVMLVLVALIGVCIQLPIAVAIGRIAAKNRMRSRVEI
jgi:BASS family bile acid:Na+ symporter